LTTTSLDSLDFAELQTLYTVFVSSGATRTSISNEAHYSIVKTTNTVNALERKGLILNAGKTRTNGGRPSYVYRTSPDMGYSVGMSVWHDRVHIVLVNGTGEVELEQSRSYTLPVDSASHASEIVERIVEAFEGLKRSQGKGKRLISLGLSLPGMVDSKNGVWLQGLQVTGISRFRIAEKLSERLQVPTYAEDIARTLAFRAMRMAPTSSAEHFVVLYLGSGIGSGIVINHRIYSGVHGLSGEIGHIEHVNNDYRCSCNNVGCLETVLSVDGIQRLFRDRLRQGVRSSLQRQFRSAELSLESILDAAGRGDRFTLMTLAEIGTFIGDSCAMIIKLYNPAYVVVSGPLSLFREFYAESVNRVIEQKVLPEMLVGYETLFADYQPSDEAHGAALNALDRVFVDRLQSAQESRQS